MANIKTPKKVVYLLGAGATHAELANLETDPADEKFLKTRLSHIDQPFLGFLGDYSRLPSLFLYCSFLLMPRLPTGCPKSDKR